jgi:ABC-type Fe3+/spermidine/putrescine transport system ATPase subunit
MASDEAVPGAEVTVSVRPQKIRLARTAADLGAVNTATATVREVLYVGAWIRLVVELTPGAVLVIENTPDALPVDYRTLRPGDQVGIGVPPEAVLVFRD